MATPTDWVPVQNTTAEPIPPGGVMRVVGVDPTSGYFLVGKPDIDNDPRPLLVNGLAAIPATTGGVTGYGQGSFDPRVIPGYDPADGLPAAGEYWGIAGGSWLLRKGFLGFVALGGSGFGLCNASRGPADAGVVEITGPPDPTSGLYPAVRSTFDPATGSFRSQEAIWVVDISN